MQVTNQTISNSYTYNSTQSTKANTENQVGTGTTLSFADALILTKENSDNKSQISSNYTKSAEYAEERAPYSYLADSSGAIHYNGVTYICDYQKNAICLGDMSNEKDVITIPLSDGGSLKVNRNNIGDLGKSIGMFSPKDVKRILDAISLDGKVKKKETEIDNLETNTYNNICK